MDKNRIKFIKSLASRREREENKLFIAEGFKLVNDLINSGLEIDTIYFTSEQDFFKLSAISTIKSEKISENEMSRISSLKNHTSILAVVKFRRFTPKNIDENSLILALDGVQDPGNLGTIIRIADWFGISHIFCSLESVDIYNPKVVQATMGAIARVETHYTSLPEFLEECKAKNLPIYATALEGDNIYTKELSKGGIIVMGNEGKGVSGEVFALANQKLYIPPFGDGQTSESLNVSVATAVVCSEFRRRLQ